jgi:hypothetical protein
MDTPYISAYKTYRTPYVMGFDGFVGTTPCLVSENSEGDK